MRFNKEQGEGLAKVLDNMATAFIVGLMLGHFIDGKVSLTFWTVIGVFAFAVILVYISFSIRGKLEVENVVK